MQYTSCSSTSSPSSRLLSLSKAMGSQQWFLLLLFLPAILKAASGDHDSSEEADYCHEQCENGCYGPGMDECCHDQCDGGCVNRTASGCNECRNVAMNGECHDDCGPAFIYNQVTLQLEPNPEFKFQHGHECVERCPKFVFTEGARCVERCSQGYREEGDQCIRCGGACPEKGEMNPLVNDQCNDVKQFQWGVISRKHRPTGNVTCTQMLIGPPGSKLKLKLYDVKIHDDIDEKLVLIADGYRQSFDRTTYETTLSLKTSALVVQHRTLAAGNGYVLAYNFIAPENEAANPSCDEVFTGNSGSFQSPSYPGKYRARESCTYHILLDPLFQVNLVFNKLYLEGEEPACLADKMEVIEPILGTSVTYCGRHKPPFTITSKTNYLVVKFTSDDKRNFKGYTAVYTAVEAPDSVEDFSVDSGDDLPPLL